jgi:hypothetical protein
MTMLSILKAMIRFVHRAFSRCREAIAGRRRSVAPVDPRAPVARLQRWRQCLEAMAGPHQAAGIRRFDPGKAAATSRLDVAAPTEPAADDLISGALSIQAVDEFFAVEAERAWARNVEHP